MGIPSRRTWVDFATGKTPLPTRQPQGRDRLRHRKEQEQALPGAR